MLPDLVDDSTEVRTAEVKKTVKGTAKEKADEFRGQEMAPLEPAKKRRKVVDSDEEIAEAKSSSTQEGVSLKLNTSTEAVPQAEEEESNCVVEAELDLNSAQKLYPPPRIFPSKPK
jgi:hypothetical protein